MRVDLGWTERISSAPIGCFISRHYGLNHSVPVPISVFMHNAFVSRKRKGTVQRLLAIVAVSKNEERALALFQL